MPTTTVDSIVSNAAEVLQDTAHARWAASELIEWLNEAQRVIANYADDADIRRENVTTVAVTKQDVSSLTSFARIVDVVRVVSTDRALVRGEKALLDSLRPQWRAEAQSADAEMWMYDDREPNIFEVYPPISASESIEVVYSAIPNTASSGGNITISDKYTPAILDYVLYRAFLKDTEDVASDMGRAAAHLGAFANLMGIKQKADIVVRPKDQT